MQFSCEPIVSERAGSIAGIIGEAAGKVSASTRAVHPEIPWREINGMHHWLIHGYKDVRLAVFWIMLRDHLGSLIAELERSANERES
jgi:uncharacterized protein with HEPN domain